MGWRGGRTFEFWRGEEGSGEFEQVDAGAVGGGSVYRGFAAFA